MESLLLRYMRIRQCVKNSYLLLAMVMLLATFLRLYKLGEIPPHLTPDEAALGYNAFSILKTGKDEYGEFLPLILKSFGDYKPALYSYLAIPSIAIFGLTEFAVRLPGALAGVIAIWLTYKIAAKLFVSNFQQTVPILAAFLLAISPWHIHFSRGAWEVNVALTFTLAGIYFLYGSLEKQIYLNVSAIFFALSLLTYQGAKLSTGIVLIIFGAMYWNEIFGFEKKTLAKSILIGMVISLPIILSMFQGKTGRLEVYSIFSYPRPESYIQNFIGESGVEKDGFIYNLFYGEPLNFARGIVGRWYKHFSGRFLFFEGDWQNYRHSAPNHGVLLLSDLIFLISGFVYVARNLSKNNRQYQFILAWLILSPLPAVLTRDQVHAVRSFSLVIPLTMLSAIGLAFLINLIKKLTSPMTKIIYSFALLILISASVVRYIDSYFIHLPKHNSEYWSYGYEQALNLLDANNYDKVYVQQSYDQPYIFYLFFAKYDPRKYQLNSRLEEDPYGLDVGLVENIDNVYFEDIDWSVVINQKNVLVIADQAVITDQKLSDPKIELVGEVDYLDSSLAFRAIKIK
jgi:4-amino-4-deoxy-L-arabinose transferase-like glycosyltransferase